MQTINVSNDSFDQDNTFLVEIQGTRGANIITATLRRGYRTRDDQILWAMKRNACLKDVYSDKDYEERARLNSMTPIKHGDVVQIEGRQYTARILGNHSDCAIFDLIA